MLRRLSGSPARVANGLYRLRLTATDMSDRTAQTELVLDANTSTKPSQYTRSDTDLTLTFGAISVPLVRGYDSLLSEQSATFGYGWRLLNRDSQIQTSVVPTGHEDTGVYNPFLIGTRVYLNLPDGRRVGYTFAPQQHQLSGVTYYTPAYDADSGVDFQLNSADTTLTRGRDGFYDLQTARPYNPASGQFSGAEYTLTAPDGTIYHLNAADGVQEQILTNDTHLYWSDTGLVSSTGQIVRFVRDTAGRVTSMTAPDGAQVVYAYDAAGNLSGAHNTASGQSDRYGYRGNAPHLLTLATTSAAKGGAAIQYGLTPVVSPVTADLGGAAQYLGQMTAGTLAAGDTQRYAFSVRPSELQSTRDGTVRWAWK